jgi:hypothetical protein
MPTSRSRKTRNRSQRQRKLDRRKRARGRRAQCWDLDPRHFTQQLEEILTEEDHREFALCLDAEAEGDAVAALQHFLATPHIVGSLHLHHLRELVHWGTEAPGWAYSRWAREQAYRWMLQTEDPRIDDVLALTAAAAYGDLDPERPMGWEPVEFFNRLAGSDWVCEQLALYECGGLADFIDARAGEGLLARTDRIEEWHPAAMRGYTIDDLEGDRLQVTEPATQEQLELLNIGALSDRDRGVPVLGRVVPIAVEPGLMFDVRPVEVDLETAREASALAQDGHDLGWIDAIFHGRRDGRLDRSFSTGLGTPLGSDIVPLREVHHHHGAPELAPGMQRLVDSGLSPNAANGVGVCEVGLIAARVSGAGPATTTAAQHVAAVLADPEVYAAARVHCTDPANEPHWRALAAGVPEPARSRCLELAILCRRAA